MSQPLIRQSKAAMIAVALIVLQHHPADAQTNESIKMLRTQQSYFGNSYPGKTRWVQNFVGDFAIAEASGQVYLATNNSWDEGGAEASVISDGQVLRHFSDTHGWGFTGGKAVCYAPQSPWGPVFIIGQAVWNPEPNRFTDTDTWPPRGKSWAGFSVRSAKDGRGVRIPGGKWVERGPKQSFKVLHTLDDKNKGQSAGIAVQGLAARGSTLFVSDAHSEKIRVINMKSMAETRSWDVESPGKMCLDGSSLWVVSGMKIIQYSLSGTQQNVISFNRQPTDIAVHPARRELWIADGKEIAKFSIETTRKLGTFGTMITNGAVSPETLIHPTVIDFDSKGNAYVVDNHGSGCVIRGLDGNGRILKTQNGSPWFLYSVAFLDGSGLTPDATSAFTTHERFETSRKKWKWAGFTIDEELYPDDPRTKNGKFSGARVVERDGQQFVYVFSHFKAAIAIYLRQPGTEILKPVGLINLGTKPADQPRYSTLQPAVLKWRWQDTNGNGTMDAGEFDELPGGLGAKEWFGESWGITVDRAGGIWLGMRHEGVYHLPLNGVSDKGIPLYHLSERQWWATPKDFELVSRVKYDPQNDTLYLSGFTPGFPYYIDGQKHAARDHMSVGNQVVRYDNWSTNSRSRTWQKEIPYDKKNHLGRGMAIELNFDAEVFFIVWKGNSNVVVHDASTGDVMGRTQIDESKFDVLKQGRWTDLPWAIDTATTADGSVVVTLEDDWRAKQFVFTFLRLAESAASRRSSVAKSEAPRVTPEKPSPSSRPKMSTAADGWITLFDGSSLDAWDDPTACHPRIANDGTIAFGKDKCWICTKDTFTNFELEFEYLVSSGGNGGVLIHCHPGDRKFAEVQILDDGHARYARVKPVQRTGSLFGVAAPDASFKQESNKFTTMNARVEQRQLQVTISGRQVLRATIPAAQDPQGEGRIGLQLWDKKLLYRKVRVRRLP